MLCLDLILYDTHLMHCRTQLHLSQHILVLNYSVLRDIYLVACSLREGVAFHFKSSISASSTSTSWPSSLAIVCSVNSFAQSTKASLVTSSRIELAFTLEQFLVELSRPVGGTPSR